MANFIHGDQLNLELINLIKEAKKVLLLVSPYIKLHDRIKDELKKKKELIDLSIIVFFGKNESDNSISFSKEDMLFLKDFPNIEIYYEKNLHAKYFGNEDKSIITSMNLHQYSQNNNVEIGVVLTKASALEGIANHISSGEDIDTASFNFFMDMKENAEKVFIKTPQFTKGFLGLGKKYEKSVIEIDNSEKHISKPGANPIRNSFSQSDRQKEHKSNRETSEFRPGYCIRTGVPIKFDPTRPYSYDAYLRWEKFSNPHYPENFCHFSGEESFGQTSMDEPILAKYIRQNKWG